MEQAKLRKTTWNDFHSDRVEKRETPQGAYISEACGRSRVKTHCPFCGTDIVLYVWHPEKRCENCGAMIAGTVSFRLKS